MEKETFDICHTKRQNCHAERKSCHPEPGSGSDKRKISVFIKIPFTPRQQTLKRVQGDTMRAFTLAEVLVTLAIIGVVAALTIPAVVRNYQKQETVTRLKKTYSALANTTNLAIAQYGPVAGWEFYDYSQTVPGTSMKGSEHFAKTYLMPYLKVSKDCGLDKCKYSSVYLNGGKCTGFSDVNKYIFILNDGTTISCIFMDYLSEGFRYANATIYIDVNGSKKPNILGKDMHYYRYSIISRDRPYGKFLPDGFSVSREDIINDPSYGCQKGKTATRCTALIMRDGWQIKDDYPW